MENIIRGERAQKFVDLKLFGEIKNKKGAKLMGEG